MSREFASIHLNADTTVTVASANTDYSVNGATVEKGGAHFAKQDPDAGANPDMKLRLGRGWWEVDHVFGVAATSAVVMGHLYMTPKGGSEAELTEHSSRTALAGGGAVVGKAVIQVTAEYADVELKLSNETNTNNITAYAGGSLVAKAMKTVATARVRH